MTRDTQAKLALVASILTSLAGAAHQFPETWNHVLLVAGIVGTALSAYLHSTPSERRHRQAKKELPR